MSSKMNFRKREIAEKKKWPYVMIKGSIYPKPKWHQMCTLNKILEINVMKTDRADIAIEKSTIIAGEHSPRYHILAHKMIINKFKIIEIMYN